MNPQPFINKSLTFTSVGDLFMFIGVLVCIGAVGAFAIYKIIKEFWYDDN
jgi:NADH:ubiquinone oxidoreductase subunit 5 (subunit L)/multisubunit Na+/H+ antiporter MnhA subunit